MLGSVAAELVVVADAAVVVVFVAVVVAAVVVGGGLPVGLDAHRLLHSAASMTSATRASVVALMKAESQAPQRHVPRRRYVCHPTGSDGPRPPLRQVLGWCS